MVTETTTRSTLAPFAAAILGYAVFAQGAFYWEQLVPVAGAFVVGACLGLRDAWRGAALFWAAMAVLAGVLLASTAANGRPADARIPAGILAAAAGASIVGRAAVIRGGRRLLLEGIAWIGSAVALAGLIGLAFHVFPWGMKAQDIWRNASTLTYSNAAGSLYMLTLPAPLLLERMRPSPVSRAMSFLCLAGLLTSLSRGAVAGLLAVGVLWAAAGGMPLLRSAIRPAAGAAVAAVGFVPSIVSDHARPAPAVVMFAAGLAIAVLPLHSSERSARPARFLIGFIAVGIVLVGGFLASPPTNRLVEARIGPRSNDRARTWRAAYEAGSTRPLLGTGPGTFEVAELIDGRILLTRYAHNELLQAWVETGGAGVGALLVASGLLAWWAWRRRPPAGEERLVWSAGFGACAGLFVHGMLDFMWHVPALVAVGFVWLSVATTRPPDRGGADGEEPLAL